MHNELLDVVDTDDAVIAQQPRAEIHANGLRHRAVHILVFNDQEQLFLQKRSMKKDLNKGLWDTSAAGHVDAGESYASCAPRELQEELGVSVDSLEVLFKLEPSTDLGMEFIQVYRCRHNGPFSLAAEEIDEGRWLDQLAVDERVAGNDPTLTLTFKIIWQQFRIISN
ncbi:MULTISPECIES: NUDIX hydrolase [Methylomonas]|uniref:NUDIX hydrolase n=2 Tax=Methylomonas TaxID=416 RepID=A0A140E6J8_9GAMM|nr:MULTISPECIES: NUDIX domain-containing protein [Methylomonas]AMK79022.1 NUDIX hydrolase [Methylomonas denitrificans]OAH96925.1 NUDIX hydrolase [Methylomonas methanica]TCV74242.1 isopentenyldiphosphate isomerase [Methylomonas methanica]